MDTRTTRRLLTVVAIFSLLASALAAAPRAVAADAGRIVVRTWVGCCVAPEKLELVDPAGGGSQSVVSQGLIGYPSWSEDGKRVVFSTREATRGVVIKSVDGGPESGFLPLQAGWPSWSPVSSEIAYWLQSPNPIPGHFSWTLKVTTADGLTTRTVAGPYDAGVDMPFVGPEQPAWSPDGKTIAFALHLQFVRVPAAGGAVTQLVAGGAGYAPMAPSYSPDGKRLAYVKMFVNQIGQTLQEQLVARDLASGAESRLADTGNIGVTGQALGHGPQSWSPDSKQIAYAEQHHATSCPPAPALCPDPVDSLMVVDATGGGGHAILQREEVGEPAWFKDPRPSYYVKHIEVAQALSPIERFPDLGDPLQATPYTTTWTVPKVGDFPIALIANRKTLIHVYVGDANLPPGATDSRTIHLRVASAGTTCSKATERCRSTPSIERPTSATSMTASPAG